MKKLLMILTLSGATASAQDPVDYNKGFCVRAGHAFSIENAVIKIDNRRVNEESLLFVQPNHNFFDFKNGALGLYAADWGGNLVLVKAAEHHTGDKQLAILSDYTHHGLHETLAVECRALD